MADFTLDIDWVSRVSDWVNKDAGYNTGIDHLTTVTSGNASWLNLAIGAVAINAQPWTTGTRYFKMRGMDQVTNGLYATWIVTGSPDFAASRYVGGLNLPLRAVTLVDTWSTG